MAGTLDTSQIKNWRSIVTLIVFVLTNLAVQFPFNVSIYVPSRLSNLIQDLLGKLRIISRRRHQSHKHDNDDSDTDKVKPFMRLQFPLNFITAPLLADLFLLAISAIGRQEVHDGTVGANNISPIDIMVFFLTLAYIAISIDASGLIRWLALKALQKGGKNGHALFFYLYAFFFCLGSFIGNDPIILSGTAFLAYMTRVSEDIHNPRAWIHAQFAVANTVSAILVSSNPTNLVLAGAFDIKFIHYTANMIVPVAVTGFVLFPFLLYVVFAGQDEADRTQRRDLIPSSITLKVVPQEILDLTPGNPNISHGKSDGEEEKDLKANNERGKLRMAEQIRNPYLDWTSAAFGAVLMSVTLITLLVLNAASQTTGEHPVYWVTLPAAFVMFCWDSFYGLSQRKKWEQGFKDYQEKRDKLEKEALSREKEEPGQLVLQQAQSEASASVSHGHRRAETCSQGMMDPDEIMAVCDRPATAMSMILAGTIGEKHAARCVSSAQPAIAKPGTKTTLTMDEKERSSGDLSDINEVESQLKYPGPTQRKNSGLMTLESLLQEAVKWSQKYFPTVTVVIAHLPFPLVPFALSMFVLVQGLVTKGWVPVFAYGWDHWVNRTGTVGAIGGMGLLSVALCNFAGTNISSAILLSRVVQSWQQIHRQNGIPITDRNFWATVYAMALGVNFGAFSAVFSASLAGLLWRDILRRKYIEVKRLEFAKVNLPIIAVAMAVGCAVLVAEVYIIRGNKPYDA
ncbi:hypothetical protein LTR10_022324 [Elasticomyces elasticus]|uniref:Citrate transporter-like domain-containing protein n=1 Tax=Exophiala sideris TaxID=1016849 RepID=A0ABR0J6W2_9EURO|nr:hypothetical protein LTR10_022324 [Elasticomyces elasticus]KAK5028766.1 hypothetical protein LTS07_006145 [Exophiala sideris]KAK5035635.1 hypothetical protein LTR13_005764 [Exophiala sideris]KAK5057270.1 hypothetical protein LTR69_007309 [Exophiala sideris]KAK5181757.1 hypothetical protein LTR44_005957 [Eurotiomycetes sp. CCFEE 6388]